MKDNPNHGNRLQELDFYTYEKNRKCKNPQCKAPIPDQEHATRQYCPRQELPDGSIKNCKDDFWSLMKKEAQSIYKEMEMFHKLMEERLSLLYDLKLPKITVDILDKTGIDLCNALLHCENDDIHKFYFLNYCVTYNLFNKQIKIIKHENELF